MSTSDAIRRAAVRLFAQHGFSGVGIRQIGREVGLNSATLYHYSGSKEDLLVEIMTSGLEALLQAGKDAVEHTADPHVQLIRLVRAHVQMEAVNPLTSQVVDVEVRALSPVKRDAVVGLRDDYDSMFQRVLERGTRTGVFQVPDVRVTRLALIAMCTGVSHWYRDDGDMSVAQLKDRFADLACRLVGAPSALEVEVGADVVVAAIDVEPRLDVTSHESAS